MSNVILRRLGPKGGVGCVTLSRPERLNTLNLSMIRCIDEALKEWITCSSLKCLLLTGEGTKAFCAGGDVKSLFYGPDGSPLQAEVNTATTNKYLDHHPVHGSIVINIIARFVASYLVATDSWWCCYCCYNSNAAMLHCTEMSADQSFFFNVLAPHL